MLGIATPALASDRTEALSTRKETPGEIVVTAQRRSEDASAVPVAITAANAQELAGNNITNIANLGNLTPSLQFRVSYIASSTANIQIRGIGTVGISRTFEGSVGVFIDGVYRTRPGQALTNFLDIDNVQILKGAQGTLFGKNTSAGAVLVTSVRPDLREASGEVEARYGNLGSYVARASLNLPLGETSAIRLAAIASGTDGNMHTPGGIGLNGNDDIGFKGQFRYEPSSSLRIVLIGDYARSSGLCCLATWDAVPGATQGLVDALTLANGQAVPSRDIADREASLSPFPRSRTIDYGGLLRAELDIGNGTLTSLTAFRDFRIAQLEDGDLSGADIFDLDESFHSRFRSQELTYNGELTGSLRAKFVAGLYFSWEKLRMVRTLRWGRQAQTFWDTILGAPGFSNAAPGLLNAEHMQGTNSSFAAFTHWTFELSPKVNVIAGARYTRERKSGAWIPDFFRDPLFDPIALAGVLPGIPYDTQSTYQAISGTIGLQYRPLSGAMFYLTYNRGFKAGGVNLDSNAAGNPGSIVLGTPGFRQSPVYAPEIINTFELGAKLSWLDGKAETNFALFHNSLTNQQVAHYLGLQFSIANVPKATSYGLEIDHEFRINRNVTLSGGLTWLPQARFGVDPILDNLSGRRFSTAPYLAANTAISVQAPLSPELEIGARLQATYTGRVFTNPDNNETQDGYVLLNGTVDLISTGSGWRVGLFGYNLLDTPYATIHANTPFQGDDRNAFLGAPRTYGVSLKRSF